MIASCSCLEEKVQECSTEEWTLRRSVETLGVDLRRRTVQPGAKEKARRQKCDLKFSFARRNCVFEKNCMEAVEDGLGLCESVGEEKPLALPLQSGAGGSSSRKNESVSLSLFMEENISEVEEDLSTMATLYWTEGVCGWEDAADHGSADIGTGERTCLQEQSCVRPLIWALSGHSCTPWCLRGSWRRA